MVAIIGPFLFLISRVIKLQGKTCRFQVHTYSLYLLADQIIHTLKMSLCVSVCNNTVVMWPLFIEVIVSFWIKKHRENLCNTGKTQGISF